MYPHERSLVMQLKDKPFALIGVNSDKVKLKKRILKEEISWRSFWNGPKGTHGPISRAWRVDGWPTIYLIDHEGVIRHKSHGGPAMDLALQKLIGLAEKAR